MKWPKKSVDGKQLFPKIRITNAYFTICMLGIAYLGIDLNRSL